MYNQRKDGWQEKNITIFSSFDGCYTRWDTVQFTHQVMYTDAGFTGYDAHHLCNIHIEALKCLQYAHSRQMEWVQGYDLLAFMFSQSYSHHIFVTMPPSPPSQSATKWDFNDVHNCTELQAANFTPRQTVSIRDSSHHYCEKRLQNCVVIRYIHCIGKPPPYEQDVTKTTVKKGNGKVIPLQARCGPEGG